MDRLVLDASGTLSWLFNEEEGSPDAILRESRNLRLFASSIWPIEVCNIANKAHQKGRVGAPELNRF